MMTIQQALETIHQQIQTSTNQHIALKAGHFIGSF